MEFQGRQLETQSVTVEDAGGKIRLQLWESQVGVALFGKTYKFCNLSTREFNGEFFLTTTRQTTIEEARPLPGLGAIVSCDVREDPIISVCAEITRAEVTVSRTCGNCRCAQMDFQSKKKFHRCTKCNMLQKTAMFTASAIANVTVVGDCGELSVSINNSVLHLYLRNCDLIHLLQDAQDVEEHLLECGSLKLDIHNDKVVAMVNISNESPSASEECPSECPVPATPQVQSVGAVAEAGPSSARGELELLFAEAEVGSVCAVGAAADEAGQESELEFLCATVAAEVVCAESESN